MFFFGKTSGKLALSLEVQSSLVRGSVIWLRPDAAPKILFSDLVAIPYKSNVDTNYFVKLTSRAIHDTIDSVERHLYNINHDPKRSKDMPKHIEEIHYVLSSPWVVSQARTVNVNYKEETTISEDKVSKLLEDERKSIAKNAESMLEPIEEKIFDVSLNGYSVGEWRGKQAKNLDISYVVTVGSSESIKRLREMAVKMVRSSHVFFHSSLLLQYVGLRSGVVHDRGEYTLIHVHGELTDVVVVEKGSCSFFGSYSVGINTVIRKIAKATSTDTKTAESLLSLYLGKKLDDSHATETGRIVKEVTAGWIADFGKLFREHPLPHKLPVDTLMSARVHEDLFAETFKASYPTARIQSLSVEDIELYALAISDMCYHK